MTVKHLKYRFWLRVMDAIALCNGFGSDLYFWAVRHAAEHVDWSDEHG